VEMLQLESGISQTIFSIKEKRLWVMVFKPLTFGWLKFVEIENKCSAGSMDLTTILCYATEHSKENGTLFIFSYLHGFKGKL
jgi:hypothetical protein